MNLHTQGVGELSSVGQQSARHSRTGQQPPTRQNQQSADSMVDATGSAKSSYTPKQATKSVTGNTQSKPRKNSQTTTQDVSHVKQFELCIYSQLV